MVMNENTSQMVQEFDSNWDVYNRVETSRKQK